MNIPPTPSPIVQTPRAQSTETPRAQVTVRPRPQISPTPMATCRHAKAAFQTDVAAGQQNGHVIVGVSERSRQAHVGHPQNAVHERPGEHVGLELEGPVEQPEHPESHFNLPAATPGGDEPSDPSSLRDQGSGRHLAHRPSTPDAGTGHCGRP